MYSHDCAKINCFFWFTFTTQVYLGKFAGFVRILNPFLQIWIEVICKDMLEIGWKAGEFSNLETFIFFIFFIINQVISPNKNFFGVFKFTRFLWRLMNSLWLLHWWNKFERMKSGFWIAVEMIVLRLFFILDLRCKRQSRTGFQNSKRSWERNFTHCRKKREEKKVQANWIHCKDSTQKILHSKGELYKRMIECGVDLIWIQKRIHFAFQGWNGEWALKNK